MSLLCYWEMKGDFSRRIKNGFWVFRVFLFRVFFVYGFLGLCFPFYGFSFLFSLFPLSFTASVIVVFVDPVPPINIPFPLTWHKYELLAFTNESIQSNGQRTVRLQEELHLQRLILWGWLGDVWGMVGGRGLFAKNHFLLKIR